MNATRSLMLRSFNSCCPCCVCASVGPWRDEPIEGDAEAQMRPRDLVTEQKKEAVKQLVDQRARIRARHHKRPASAFFA